MSLKNNFTKLSSADLEEWLKASQDIKKLKITKAPVVSNIPYSLKNLSIDQKTIFTPPSSSRSIPINLGDSGNLSKKVARQMNRGKIFIDARIDLHGSTEISAFNQLVKFIKSCYHSNYKMVLVITGKGSLIKPAIIKARLPHWINSDQLSPFIIRFTQAIATDGGSGAFYLYLTKNKNSY